MSEGDLVGTVRAFTALVPSAGGANLTGPCPFCTRQPPSFQVNPARQLWHCFECERGGDLDQFLRAVRDDA